MLGLGARARQKLALPGAADLESAFLDTTCPSALIHHPVDRGLLRDATRTLTKAVQLSHDQGLMQARQRIPQGVSVADEEKISGLYEADVHVVVRKKASAEVEFGNPLLLAENPQGLIVDWELFKEEAPAIRRCCVGALVAWNKPMAPNSRR